MNNYFENKQNKVRNMSEVEEMAEVNMVVMPAHAQSLFNSRAKNRAITESHVDDFENKMKTNTFVKEIARVYFNMVGRLANGQHKILAAVRFNKPVEMIFVYNTPDRVLKELDSCELPVTLQHKLEMYQNISNAKFVASTVQRMECIKQKRSKVKLNDDYAAAEYVANREAFDYVQEKLGKNERLGLVGVNAALVLAWKTNPEVIKNFINDYIVGGNNISNNPAHVFSDAVKINKKKIRQNPRALAFGAFKAFKKYLNSETITRVHEPKNKAKNELLEYFINQGE